jgi:hypothetical protein
LVALDSWPSLRLPDERAFFSTAFVYRNGNQPFQKMSVRLPKI